MAPRDEGGPGGDPGEGQGPGNAHDLFHRLHERYAPSVYAFFLRRGFSEADSFDLTQDTFLRVLKSKGGPHSEVAEGNWILRIAANVWKNELRRRKTVGRTAPEVSLEAQMEHGEPRVRENLRVGSGAPPNPLDSTLARERVAAASEVLAVMAPQRRRCLLLHGARELQVREIGELLGLSPETVKSHIHLGRRQLRERFKQRFGEEDGR